MSDEKSGQRSNILIKVGGLLGAIAVVTTALNTIVTDGSTIWEKLSFRKMPGTTESSGRDSSSFENKTLMIMETRGGKCIDVAGSPGRHNGDRLQLWDCEISGTNIDNNVRTDQRWKITSDGYIRNELSGKCIDVGGSPGVENGTGLGLWNCEISGTNIDNNVRTDQRWKITSDGYIRNELSGKCIDVDGSPTNDGVGLVLGDCELSPKFKLEGY